MEQKIDDRFSKIIPLAIPASVYLKLEEVSKEEGKNMTSFIIEMLKEKLGQ